MSCYRRVCSYRSGHSSETALLRIHSELIAAADAGSISHIAMLDLSSSFDCVDHASDPHSIRSNYIAMRNKSYVTNSPNIPAIEEGGWQLNHDVNMPVRCLAMPAPRAVIELTECACKACMLFRQVQLLQNSPSLYAALQVLCQRLYK
jgi:hypothetical protein